jgi:hypothetical protein
MLPTLTSTALAPLAANFLRFEISCRGGIAIAPQQSPTAGAWPVPLQRTGTQMRCMCHSGGRGRPILVVLCALYHSCPSYMGRQETNSPSFLGGFMRDAKPSRGSSMLTSKLPLGWIRKHASRLPSKRSRGQSGEPH